MSIHRAAMGSMRQAQSAGTRHATVEKAASSVIASGGVLWPRQIFAAVALSIAQTYLLAIDRRLKEPGAAILFKVARLNWKSMEWLLAGARKSWEPPLHEKMKGAETIDASRKWQDRRNAHPVGRCPG